MQAELADSGILRDIGLARGRAKMLIRINSTTSSIGGGNVDFEVCWEAQKMMAEGKPKVMQFYLTGRETMEEAMICGGITGVFLKPVFTRCSR